MSLELTDRIKGKPELIKLTETDESFVLLSWRETPGAQQYIIEKLNRETGAFDKIARLPEDVFEYCDEDVETAHVYTYRVMSKRVKKDGSLMVRRGASQNVTLSDPHQVRMRRADHPCFGVADLAWEKDEKADGYRVNRRPIQVSTPLPLAYIEGQTLSFRDDTLVSGQIYYYCVQSFRKADDDELIFSHMGDEIMVVNLDETEILKQKRGPARSISFHVRVTAGIDCYVLCRAEKETGVFEEVARSKDGLDLKLSDKAPAGWKDAYYTIRCLKRYRDTEYLSDGTKPVHIKL